MDDRVTAAERELEQINKKLAEHPLFRRKEELETFLRVAKTLSSTSGNRAVSGTVRANARIVTGSAPIALTFKDRVIQFTEYALKGGVHMYTRDIVKELEKQGIQIPTKNDIPTEKVLRISAILVKAPQFRSDRTLGWSLNTDLGKNGPPKGEARTVRSGSGLVAHA